MATVASAAEPLGAAGGPPVECGALTVALAHAIAAATGEGVLVVDADAAGTRLTARVAAATATVMPTARRGLPTLVAARGGIRADSIERHCWALPERRGGAGRVLLAGAAAHPAGAARTACWAAEHAEELAALPDAHHSIAAVLVSLANTAPDAIWGPLRQAACLHVGAAPASGTAAPGGLRGVLAAFGRHPAPDPIIELRAARVGAAPDRPRNDNAGPMPARTHDSAAGMPVLLGSVGPVRERALLGARPRRSERVALDALGAAAARLAALGAHSTGSLGRPDATDAGTARAEAGRTGAGRTGVRR